ncbi:MAG: YlbF family regulator [Lachnospiraceae bacterium]|nr:YlbF family regulator [Lachnospiraceae bacterium]
MKQIKEATYDLIHVIQESSLYVQYQECLGVLKKKKKVYAEYDEFRKQHYKLMRSQEDNFDEVEALQQKYRDVLMDHDVVAFMEATDRLTLALKEMYIDIADEIELDIDFVDEI